MNNPLKISWKAIPAALLFVAIGSSGLLAAPLPGGTLDPLTIPKYVQPLVIPPEMPKSADVNVPTADYNIAVRQFQQQILPGGVWNSVNGRNDNFGATTLWSYGRAEDVIPPGFIAPAPVASGVSFNYPSFTIETISQPDTANPTRIRWINDLVDGSGNFLPHLFEVDQTLHWANPGKDLCRDGSNRTDCATNNPAFYDGPVPIVTHVHGAHVNAESDGYPEAWWLPAANNLPAKYLDPVTGQPNTGTIYTQYDNTNTVPGSAFYAYENDQPAATLWYHDHSLGMTRLNVYAGPAGFYLVRGGNYDGATDGVTGLPAALPGPAPSGLGDPNFDPAYRSTIREVPIAIQDRSFNADGSLFYPDTRAFFDGYFGPYTGDPAYPDADIAPIWNPEAFFNTMVVNGTTWPVYNVAPERYRLRLLNGCNSRFLNLSMFVVNTKNPRKVVKTREVPFYQIGAEQGFLPQVVEILTGFATPWPGDGTVPIDRIRGPFKDQALLMGPAERADVIVDFSQFKPGTVIRMYNTAPDAPFGGFPDVPADPSTTGQVMQFVVGASTGQPDPSTPVPNLVLNAEPTYNLAAPAPNGARDLSLNEGESEHICVNIDPAGNITFVTTIANPFPDIATACGAQGAVPMAPKEALLGGVVPNPMVAGGIKGNPLTWSDNITENPGVGDTETWNIYNFTVDGHPIHLHLVRFQVEGRQALDPLTQQPIGAMVAPPASEAGWKDTVIAYPGEVTRIRATFDKEGLYVWHCHIVEHEDNEMMRPYYVGPIANSPVP